MLSLRISNIHAASKSNSKEKPSVKGQEETECDSVYCELQPKRRKGVKESIVIFAEIMAF